MAGRKITTSTMAAADLAPLDGTEIVRLVGDPTGTAHSGHATTDDLAELALAKVLNEGVTGPAGPAGADGADGAPGADGADGAPGADGADGVVGVDGKSYLSGPTVPSNGLGSDGDSYLHTVTGDTYAKAAGSWSPDGGNLKGPQGDAGSNGVDGADGAQGAQGDAGPQGIQGVPGNDGADGADGATGPAGNMVYSGTGAPGAGLGGDGDKYFDETTGDFYVKAVGSWSVQANLVGPQGAQGDAGPQGVQGIAGNDGADGAPGVDGADGVDGATGPAGTSIHSGTGAPSGALGNDGDKYFDEATGDFYAKASGAWGAAVANLVGPAGSQGDAGPQGIQGVAGAAGSDGADGAPGANGADGADGVDGADGFSFLTSPGVPGSGLGNDGDKAVNEATGDVYSKAGGSWSATGGNLKGPQGDQGVQGVQGDPGAAGADGAPGADGADGAPGAAGADGADGADGAGLAAGGAVGQIATKNSGTDYDVGWSNPPTTATTAAEGLTELATAAEYRSKATGAKALTAETAWDAAAEVTLTDAATIAWDLSTGLDFTVTIQASRTIASPSNAKPGQKGRLRVVQGAGGNHALTLGANFVTHQGEGITLSAVAADEDIIYFDVISPTKILLVPSALAVAA